MLLRKLFDRFLSPLSLSLLFFLLSTFLLFFKKKHQKLVKTFLIIGILFLYFTSIFPGANFLLSFLENKYQIPKKYHEASFVILLLGGERNDNDIFYSTLSLATLQRTICLAAFYKKNNLNLPIIISGRDPLEKESQEGKKVKELLNLFGIPQTKIFLEENSRTTKESAQNLKNVLKNRKALLFTSAFHMPRSVLYFKKEKINVIPFPCDFRQKRNLSLIDFLPRFQALENSSVALREYFGILVFYLGF
jgi:uncharacterized SAM-binding protein YcdF (DUF218 family)